MYSLEKVIEQDIIYDTERTGDMVSVINPYTKEINDACVKSLDITFGGFLKARGKFLVDFVPHNLQWDYSIDCINEVVQAWQVPSAVPIIKGYINRWRLRWSWWTRWQRGNCWPEWWKKRLGWRQGGESGKVLNTTLNVTPGQNLSYTGRSRWIRW